jgi:DNA topoisomerase-1
VRDAKRLTPTETGTLVNDLITEHFPEVVDIGFTAHMEEDLDRIAAGEQPWVETVREFYAPFYAQVERADKLIPERKAELEKIGRACPQCGHDLVIRWGRFGKFISCSNFPECRYTEAWLEKIGVRCPKDQGEIVERKTRKGRLFYGCANYPNCDFTSWKRPLPVACPNCGGLLVVADKRNAQCLQCEEQYPLDQVSVDEAAETA